MLRIIITITAIITLTASSQAMVNTNGDQPMKLKTNLQDNSKKGNKEQKWILFWKDFTSAVNAKDKKRIAALSSKDFYDGGGGTINEWLDIEVFFSDKHFNDFRSILKKGAKNFKSEGDTYKATGKNDSGDLFFEYKNDHWEFGGVVGD